MSELDQLLLKEWFLPANLREQVIYHYTSAAGLIGILQSASIRGTSAAFLNDISLCRAVLESELSTGDPVDARLLGNSIDALEREPPHEIFVTCFSTTDDVLGQWRGYGSAAGRYSIGFQLAGFSERDALRFPQRVEYDPDTQRARVRHAINLTRDHLSRASDDCRDFFNAMVTLSLYLRRLICLFKHPGFSAEEEWRSVSPMNESGTVGHIHFTPIDGMPRPHLTMLQGSRQSQQLPVVRVRVGASTRPDAALFATRLLLQRLGYHNVEVTTTEIPLAP